MVDEMLVLLACGKARAELKEFLIEELTEKVPNKQIHKLVIIS